AQLIEGQLVEFASGFKSEPDRLTNFLVCLAERHSLVCEVGRSGHRVEVSLFSSSLHRIVAEAQRPCELGQYSKDSFDCIGGVKDGLLALLQVFVVGEWKALDDGCQGYSGALQSSGLAPNELRQVGVLLLRHGARSG